MSFQISSMRDGELVMTFTEKGMGWELPGALFGCIFDLVWPGASGFVHAESGMTLGHVEIKSIAQKKH